MNVIKKQKSSNMHPSKPTSLSVKGYNIVKEQTSKPLFVLLLYALWQKARRSDKKSIMKKTPKSAYKKNVKSNPWARFSRILGRRKDSLDYQRKLRSTWS